MKNISLICLLIALLAACSAPIPSPTATVTASPTVLPVPSTMATEMLPLYLTDTPTATPMSGASEPVPAFDPKTMDKVDLITSTDKVERVAAPGGAVVHGSFNLTESVTNTGLVKEIDVTDKFGADTLLKIAYILSHQGQGEPTDEQLRVYGEQLSKVQNGKSSCSTVEARTFAFDAKVPGDKQLPMTLQMFCVKGEISEGATRIDTIEIVYIYDWGVNEAVGKYVIPEDRPRMAGNSSGAFEIEIDNNTLRVKINVSPGFEVNPEWNMATTTALFFSWLNKNNVQIPPRNLQSNNSYANKGKVMLASGFSVR